VAEKEQMSETPNSESVREQAAQRPTPINREQALNVDVSPEGTTSNIKLATGRVRPTGGRRTSNIPSRIVDLIVGGIFIYAGVLKMLDPVRFASDIDNYKILPWSIGVALAFYLPWLEIFCGIALILRLLYRGALSILTALILIFTLATVAAKVRGLDITCGCFGHASQHWSFPAHMATDLAILAALLVLGFSNRLGKP
jgi:putative oxidoreductase